MAPRISIFFNCYYCYYRLFILAEFRRDPTFFGHINVDDKDKVILIHHRFFFQNLVPSINFNWDAHT